MFTIMLCCFSFRLKRQQLCRLVSISSVDPDKYFGTYILFNMQNPKKKKMIIAICSIVTLKFTHRSLTLVRPQLKDDQVPSLSSFLSLVKRARARARERERETLSREKKGGAARRNSSRPRPRATCNSRYVNLESSAACEKGPACMRARVKDAGRKKQVADAIASQELRPFFSAQWHVHACVCVSMGGRWVDCGWLLRVSAS